MEGWMKNFIVLFQQVGNLQSRVMSALSLAAHFIQ